jgi:uncharacterized protein YceK
MPMRFLVCVLMLSSLLAGCTTVIQLRNQKTGQTATCGGELMGLTSGANDRHCLQFFHQQGFDPVTPAP